MSLFFSYTDEALVNLLAGSEADKAFEELYNRYWEKLVVQAKIKLRNETDAEEVVQQVFINLWRRRSRIILKYNFHTYIASAIKFEILNLLAKQKKLEELHISASFPFEESQDSMSEQLDYNHKLSLLQDEFEKLPEKTKIIFSLSRQEEMSGREIATKLNVSPKTVEAHITKALKQLRAALSQFLSFISIVS